MLPAVEAVFDTTEILEAILLQVPTDVTEPDCVKNLKTLLHAQRVCRRWKLVIERSVKLQQALFFQPVDMDVLHYRSYALGKGEEARLKYGLFTESNQEVQADVNPLLLRLTQGRWYYCRPCVSSIRVNLPPEWQFEEASWRKILLTKPGVGFSYSQEAEDKENEQTIVTFNTKRESAGDIHSKMA